MRYVNNPSTNSVEFQMTSDHMIHLFGDLDLRTVRAGIKVLGTWKGGLTFKPVIMRSASGNDEHTGNYMIAKKFINSEQLYCFETPTNTLKLNYIFSKHMRQTAEIKYVKSPNRTILVIPTEVVQTLRSTADLSKSKSHSYFKPTQQIVEESIFNTNVESTTAITETIIQPEIIQIEKIIEAFIEKTIDKPIAPAVVPALISSQTNNTIENQTVPDQGVFDISYAKLIIEDINAILSIDPKISATVAEDGKSVSFTRLVRKRVPVKM